MNNQETAFYPQDEMTTMLLPVTQGCPYNQCVFCNMYQDYSYQEIHLQEIEMQLMNGYPYTEKIFLLGADPLTVGFDHMARILSMVQQYLPYCAQVASYASIRSISNYTVEELAFLHNSGLRLLYIGFETGSNAILKLINKGHTVEQAIAQALKLNQAHLPFNTIVMYGIAGKGESLANAQATAAMINSFDTQKVITMCLKVFHGTELDQMVRRGKFLQADRTECLLEIKTLVEQLNPRNSLLFDTTHPTNIIKIQGRLPQDRAKLIAKITHNIELNAGATH